MNSKLLFVLAIVAATTFSSCKKEYTCKCQKIYTDDDGSSTSDDGTYTYKDSRTRAEERCNANEETGSDLGGDYSRECSID